MKSNRIVASTVAALFVLGMSASAGATEPETTPTEIRAAEDTTASADSVTVVKRDTDHCVEFCELGELPVYVPPSRGSVAHRIGGGTRGGGFRS